MLWEKCSKKGALQLCGLKMKLGCSHTKTTFSIQSLLCTCLNMWIHYAIQLYNLCTISSRFIRTMEQDCASEQSIQFASIQTGPCTTYLMVDLVQSDWQKTEVMSNNYSNEGSVVKGDKTCPILAVRKCMMGYKVPWMITWYYRKA